MLTILYLDPSLDCGELGPLIDDSLALVGGSLPCLTADEWIDLRAALDSCPLQRHAETPHATR